MTQPQFQPGDGVVYTEYLKLASAPGLDHPGYPLCQACATEVDFEDHVWLCPSCGTSWPGDRMEDDGSGATLYEDWAGEELPGPTCPTDFAWRVSDLPPDQRAERIAAHLRGKR